MDFLWRSYQTGRLSSPKQGSIISQPKQTSLFPLINEQNSGAKRRKWNRKISLFPWIEHSKMMEIPTFFNKIQRRSQWEYICQILLDWLKSIRQTETGRGISSSTIDLLFEDMSKIGPAFPSKKNLENVSHPPTQKNNIYAVVCIFWSPWKPENFLHIQPLEIFGILVKDLFF